MADGDYERRDSRMAELKKFGRLIAEAHTQRREEEDKGLDENTTLHQ